MIVYINPDDPLMNDGNGKIKIFKENKLAIVFLLSIYCFSDYFRLIKLFPTQLLPSSYMIMLMNWPIIRFCTLITNTTENVTLLIGFRFMVVFPPVIKSAC